MRSNYIAYVALAIAVMAAVAIWWYGRDGRSTPTVDVTVPALSPLAQVGGRMFTQYCAECHGANAAGSGKGPPLVHRIYEPGHHADESFRRAVQFGVRAHHWQYGNMPSRPEVRRDEVTAIVRYVRELQTANGIR